MRISDWSSDVCSSDLIARQPLTHTVMYTGAKNECSLWLATNVELMGIFKLARVEACRLRRSEEHTSELQSLMRISYAVFCLKKKTIDQPATQRLRSSNI